MRDLKLFSERIMNKHPTQGHKNKSPRKPGSRWSSAAAVSNKAVITGLLLLLLWQIAGK